MMAKTIWYRCLIVALTHRCPEPGEIAGIRIGRIIAICGMLFQVRLTAGDKVSSTGFTIPALATRLITHSAQLTS